VRVGDDLTGVELCSQQEYDARTEAIENGEASYPVSERTLIIGSDGKLVYVESHPVLNDGPTSVFVTSGDREYSFALNEDETVSVIGGADGPTSIFVTQKKDSEEK